MKVKRYSFFSSLPRSHHHSKDVFAQLINEHLKCSTAMETPATPSMNINNKDNDDEQNFYSAPPSRMFNLKIKLIIFSFLFV
jgi:hypothetical protein